MFASVFVINTAFAVDAFRVARAQAGACVGGDQALVQQAGAA